ncbi:MAG: hypothetical protein JWN86_1418 [Planctomycetota bacterium]|nr:hypothetical protein [Planctomycetota bacterium]
MKLVICDRCGKQLQGAHLQLEITVPSAKPDLKSAPGWPIYDLCGPCFSAVEKFATAFSAKAKSRPTT